MEILTQSQIYIFGKYLDFGPKKFKSMAKFRFLDKFISSFISILAAIKRPEGFKSITQDNKDYI